MEQRLPRRRKMRLPEYDYSSAGYYFITICTKDKRCFFGKIVGRADPGAPCEFYGLSFSARLGSGVT